MKGMCVAMLCLLGVAMVIGGGEPGEGRPPPPDVKFLLRRFLDGPARDFVEGMIAGQCKKIFADLDIEAPPAPTTPTPTPTTPGEDKRSLSSLLSRYLHRQKRGGLGPSPDELRELHFCMRFMFEDSEDP